MEQPLESDLLRVVLRHERVLDLPEAVRRADLAPMRHDSLGQNFQIFGLH